MARDNDKERNVRCSFCGKAQEIVKRIVAGPNGVFICDECRARKKSEVSSSSPA